MIFVSKFRFSPCTPWLILTYWTPPGFSVSGKKFFLDTSAAQFE
jgi:hypothetical protein